MSASHRASGRSDPNLRRFEVESPAPPPQFESEEAEALWKRLLDSAEDRKNLSSRLELVERRMDDVVDNLAAVQKGQGEILLALHEHKAQTADRFASLVMRVGAGFGGGAVAGGGAMFAAFPLVKELAKAAWRFLAG